MNAVQFPPLHCFFTDLVGGWFSLWILYAKKETVREIKKRRANQQKTESEWRQPLSLKMVTMETVPFFPLLLSVWSCTFLCNSGYKLAPPTPLYSFIEPWSDRLEAEVGFDRIITGNAYKVTVCIQLYLSRLWMTNPGPFQAGHEISTAHFCVSSPCCMNESTC